MELNFVRALASNRRISSGRVYRFVHSPFQGVPLAWISYDSLRQRTACFHYGADRERPLD